MTIEHETTADELDALRDDDGNLDARGRARSSDSGTSAAAVVAHFHATLAPGTQTTMTTREIADAVDSSLIGTGVALAALARSETPPFAVRKFETPGKPQAWLIAYEEDD